MPIALYLPLFVMAEKSKKKLAKQTDLQVAIMLAEWNRLRLASLNFHLLSF